MSSTTRRAVDGETSAQAARSWWDSNADEYLAEHGQFLAAALIWGPEGVSEQELALLSPYEEAKALEIGAGAAQGAAYLAARGANAIALDISGRMLAQAKDPLVKGVLVQGDARRLPFQDESFDIAFSSYGALPFLPEAGLVLAEWRRVVRRGGRIAFSVTHPIRWAFPDSPNEDGLTATGSYFDRRPYVEESESGKVTYSEHHRTIGDWVDAINEAKLHLARLVEPEWKPGNEQTWGAWSPLRGAHIPGTAIFLCQRLN